jgi:hypothetical protein
VRVLSRLFRRLFLTRLADAHVAGRLAFFGEITGLRRREAFIAHLAPLRRKKWFVYAKPPFAGPEAVLAYLARYTHRVAIANSRLVSLDKRGVTFRYKDYRRDGRARFRTMTLIPNEFIRRFLLHVLPKAFHRIRHYGLLASATCKANIARAKELIAAPLPSIDPCAEHVVADEAGTAADHRPPCPHCGGRMIIVESFGRSGEPRAPPPKPGSAPRCHDAPHCLPISLTRRRTPLPAMHRCRPTVPEGSSYTLDRGNIAASTPSASPPLSIRPHLSRPAHPPPEPLPG